MERRLAAIMATDVVGYSRLMGEDEAGTLARLKAHREELIDPKIDEHHGRIVKLMGDGTLVEFASVVDAVLCAVEIQRGMSARNAGVAEPGGICVRRNVRNQVRDKLDFVFVDLGEVEVKNIARPVRVFRLVLDDAGTEAHGSASAGAVLALPDKPSIAVLSFENMSGDPEQEFFADGMAEEIITALSRYRWFFVIARNSSFTYKGRAVDVTQVAKELGVRYVLEGSVRKAGNRVRVTAQLIDATTGNHIWAERYDRELDDIFALQDEITETIVTAIEPELGAVERERARRKPPENLDAWGSFQRGLWHFFTYQNREGLAEAKRLFQRSCELDPGFATAYAELAWTHIADIHRGFADDPGASLEQAARAAEQAVALDARDPVARFALGRVHIFRHAYENAIAEMEAALDLNASSDRAYYCLGLAFLYGGRAEDSIPQLERAIRLNPRSPILWAYLDMLARAYFNSERYEEAVEWFEKASQQPNASFLPFVHGAAALGHLDRLDEARGMFAEGLKRKPDFTADTVARTLGVYGRYSGAERILDGLGRACLLAP